jgi:Na+-transporting NADH:ubiquinone oxidoreductase subunit NqrB
MQTWNLRTWNLRTWNIRTWTIQTWDARIYQILFLSSFLMLGIGTRDWALQPVMILVAIATCLTCQYIAATILNLIQGSEVIPRQTLLSALITALGLSLLLRVDDVTTMALASAIAIFSKFLLQIQGKHLFNPANIGIVAVLLLTHSAWVSPGQWGEESLYVLMFLGAGGIVLQRVGRWDTSIVFLAAYGTMEALRVLWLGWTWDVWMHRLMNGSLLLFALFMITDPRTIPNSRTGRVMWAIAIAFTTFILRNLFYIPTAAFWSLFLLSPLTILIDILLPSDRFQWSSQLPQATPELET